jgi:hypothetical protein
MSALYSDWQLTLTWLLVTALSAVFYFMPIAQLLPGLGE